MFKSQVKSSEYESVINSYTQKAKMLTWIVVCEQPILGFLETGTVVTLFYSIRCYHKMTDIVDDGGAQGAKMQDLEAEMKAAIPVRKRTGMLKFVQAKGVEVGDEAAIEGAKVVENGSKRSTPDISIK